MIKFKKIIMLGKKLKIMKNINHVNIFSKIVHPILIIIPNTIKEWIIIILDQLLVN